MNSQNKKLSLKKVTVLNFDEARRITGATGDEGCDITDIVNCPATGPSCPLECFPTEEITCNAECFSY